MYAEIINNEIFKIHSSLPTVYNNISNFFALEKENLKDLSWSGNEGVKFYECQENIPTIPENHHLVGPTYVIDHENNLVILNYTTEENIGSPQINIPDIITATQIRLWLVNNNISLESIDNAISAIGDPLLREKTRVQWEYAPYVERNHPFINMIGDQLGLGSSQIDQAFIEASQL